MQALIACHDWASTPLGDPQRWPERLKSAVEICLSSPLAMSVWWGPELISIHNDASVANLGIKHPHCLGHPAADVWAEVWTVINPRVARVLRNGTSVQAENVLFMLDRGLGPQENYFTVVYSPLREQDGSIAGVLTTAIDTTAKVLAARGLDAHSERQRRLFMQAPGFIAILSGPRHTYEFVNDTFAALFGARDYIGRTALEAFPELADQSFLELLDQVFRTGERFVGQEVRVDLRAAGERGRCRRFLDFVVAPTTGEDGRVTGIFVEGHDVTGRVETETSLRESEQRFRAVANLVPDMLWSNDAEGRLAWFNKRWHDYTGLSHEESIGTGWLAAIHPDDRAATLDSYEQALSRGDSSEHQHRLRRRDGEYRWHLARLEPVQTEKGEIASWFGALTDVDELKRLQQQEHLLLAELQHRVRNTLAMMRSIVRRSADHSHSVADYLQHVDGRIGAFARTQAQATRDTLRGVRLDAIIADELTAHGAHAGEKAILYGPEVRLKPAAADRIGLAVHELATNAVEHGALAADSGQVHVWWAVTQREAGPALVLRWTEEVPGGIAPPARQGFGTELLTQNLPYELGATTVMDYPATGLQFEMAIPLARLVMPEMSSG